jgi:5-methylcytosine-specific restriction endonuclease McrA
MSNPAYQNRVYRKNRQLVLAAAGGKCCWPGCQRPATTTDHIIPLAKGGSDALDNLRPMCRHHNSVLGAELTNRIKAERKNGRRSRRW